MTKLKHLPYAMVSGYAKLAGYSMEQIAIKLHMTRRTLDHKINGSSDFTISEAKALESLLGQSRESIFLTSDVT